MKANISKARCGGKRFVLFLKNPTSDEESAGKTDLISEYINVHELKPKIAKI